MFGFAVRPSLLQLNGKTLHTSIIFGLLIGSTLLNVFQARKVSQLRNALVVLKSEGRLSEGSTVPAIDARDAYKNTAKLTYESDGPPTVLYVFSPSCIWCSRNLDSVKTLAKSLKGTHRFATISLSEDKLQEYIAEKDFQFPVYAGLTPKTLMAYKLGGTPQTMVLSSDGRVQKNWMGAYAGETKSEIESYFNIQLPDITQAAK